MGPDSAIHAGQRTDWQLAHHPEDGYHKYLVKGQKEGFQIDYTSLSWRDAPVQDLVCSWLVRDPV